MAVRSLNQNQTHSRFSLIFAVALLCVAASAETLPDAPQSQKHFDRTWLVFTGAAALDLAASAYDTHITLVGVNSGHGCYEANPALVGKYPHASALYAKNLGISGGLIGLGVLFKKLHLPIAPYAAMGIDTAKHAHGAYAWYHFKDGACL